MGKVNAGPLKKFTAKSKKRRTDNTTRVKYQAPTARNQRKQILTNAKSIKRLYEMTLPKQVFTDWQYIGEAFAAIDPQGSFTQTWAAFPLTSFGDWAQCLRQDDNTTVSSTTMVDRMQLNMRYVLGKSNYAFFDTFIVTLRKDAANRDPPLEFQQGIFPTAPVDFIEGPLGTNARLNSALYKVHYASYHTLTGAALLAPAVASETAGNPFSTWRKGQANIKVKANIRNPVRSTSWRQLPYQAQPYYRRYFLLVRIVQGQSQGTQEDTGASFYFDQLATCINTS